MATGSKIEPFDLERMLFGDAPPEFLIEVFFRGLALYVFMLVIVRLLGKRMAGELTITEMVLMITLGGSVAVAMQVPEGGALIGFVVLTCALIFEKAISKFTMINQKFEALTQGKVTILIKDGVLQIKEMRDTRITREQVFAALRNEKIHQLGEVQRLYLEAGGGFSIYKNAKDIPAGLAIFPEEDSIVWEQERDIALKTCYECGYTVDSLKAQAHCSSCEGSKWTEAIL